MRRCNSNRTKQLYIITTILEATNASINEYFQGKELPAKDLSGTSDPYVRVTLLPDKKHRLETKIKRRTLNPRWNETFYFEGFPIQKLQSRVLHLHVFDYDRFSRDDSIGEVFLPLCQVRMSENPPVEGVSCVHRALETSPRFWVRPKKGETASLLLL